MSEVSTLEQYSFWQVLADQIACDASKCLGVDIPFMSIAKKVTKGNKTLYSVGGEVVGISETGARYQGFHFMHDMTMTDEKKFSKYIGVGGCLGFTASTKLSFVLFGWLGCSDNDLWKLLKVFHAGKCVNYKEGGKTAVSGRITAGKIENDPVIIGRRWFPNQRDVIQQLQMELMAIEVQYTILAENVCVACLPYKRD